MKVHKGVFKDMLEVGDLDIRRNLDRLDACPHEAKNMDDGKNKHMEDYLK